MNKIIAILGIIVLITLGALFFFIGFFTGTTTPLFTPKKVDSVVSDADIITQKKVDSVISAQSGSISDKVLKILSAGASSVSSSVSKLAQKTKQKDSLHISSDALLKEIIASHNEHDDCSIQKTQRNILNQTNNFNSLRGKKVVFIGYFKDDIALQIQKLLAQKGYKVHVEQSKTSPGESFVFCGPFQKTENAEKLAFWLNEHSFSEAKVINVTQGEVEETLVNSMGDSSELPMNAEMQIPEISNAQMSQLQNAANRQILPPSQTAINPANANLLNRTTPVTNMPTQHLSNGINRFNPSRPQMPQGIPQQPSANRVMMPGVARPQTTNPQMINAMPQQNFNVATPQQNFAGPR